MIQILYLGSSSVYGVGASEVGFSDYVKRELHRRMFSDKGIGEKYEIYNFGKSGATVDFVIKNFPIFLEQFGRGGKVITVANVGGNNSKAEDRPDNFVSTLDEYVDQMSELIDLLKEKSSKVMFVGSGFVDESKNKS
ncbi:MAG: SGNH/GDSL hydrolase family protein [Patescibacteria group bacterium]|nr:SGNH/GDSL hydrolase family protein [Patescibacteria group bacterium]